MARTRSREVTPGRTHGRADASRPDRRVASLAVLMTAALASLPARATGADTTPPSVPTGLRASHVESRLVQLAWEASSDPGSGIQEYVVQRDEREIGRTALLAFGDGAWLVPDSTYFYSVAAVDRAGNRSAASAPVAVTPPRIERALQQLAARVVLLNFLDAPGQPFDLAKARAVVLEGATSLAAYLDEVSYGAMSLSGTAHGWYTIQKRLTDYDPPPWFYAGQAYGIDPADLRADALAAVPPSVLAGTEAVIFAFEGVGTYGMALGSDVLVSARNGFNLPTLAHEIAHTLGDVWHAGSWRCEPPGTVGADPANPTASCPVARYGDRYDPVGSGPHHYSTLHKELLGFMPAGSSAVAEVDGDYVLDQVELPSTGRKALRVPLGPSGLFYFLEYRRPVGFDALPGGGGAAPVDGVLVRLHADGRYGVDAETLLVPGLVLSPGVPFEDPYRGIRVEVVETIPGEAGASDRLRLRVTRANQPPSLAPIGDRTATVDSRLTLTVDASDPDGDPLALSAASLPAGASFDSTARTFSWRPAAADVGAHRLAFRASDGELSDTEAITITVAEAAGGGSQEITLQIDRAADDYKETASGAVGMADPTHDVWTQSDYKQAFRFRRVPLPRGAEILEARLEVYAVGSFYAARSLRGRALGEASGNAPAYKGKPFEITDARKTRASTVIEKLAPWTSNAHNPVADVTAIVQEIVDRSDWAWGNAVKLFLTADSTAEFRRTRTYNSAPERAAKLFVRYRTPAGGA